MSALPEVRSRPLMTVGGDFALSGMTRDYVILFCDDADGRRLALVDYRNPVPNA